MIGKALHRCFIGIGYAMRRMEQQDRIAFDADIANPKKQSASGLAVTNDAEFFAARIIPCDDWIIR